MNKVLKNLQLTFGETSASPKVLTIASVNTLIKAIEDTEVNTKFSGHITSESGSLTAAQAYSLAIAGLTFHGNITPVDFTLKANTTEVVDGSEILFTTTGVPTSAIDFTVSSTTVNSGNLTEEDVNNICSIENNKLIVAPAGVTSDWQATVEVKATTKYTPATEKTISIVIKHKAYSSISNQTSVNFDTPNTISIPLSFTPVDANVPIESIRATLENVSAVYQVGVSGYNVNITCNSVDDLIFNKINIEATDIAGKLLTSSINISNKVTTTPSIVSEDSFVAKNGKGSLQCTFGFTPEKYNVDIEFVSVVSSNSLTTISNASINGFTIKVDGCIEDMPTTLTAKIKVDGVVKTITKTINIVYKQIFNEFKVYANSAWVVPTSNVEVKVGELEALYVGDGIWMVPEDYVDETMDVTVGGVVLGKYGKNEYYDDTCPTVNVELTRLTNSLSGSSSESANDSKIVKNVYGRVLITSSNSAYRGYAQTFYSIGNGAQKTLGSVDSTYGSFQAKESLDTSTDITLSYNIYHKQASGAYASVSMYLYSIKNNPQKPLLDLSLPSTSLIAKNGTLNELITPTTPNTNDVVLTSVYSSNSAITAVIEDGQIRLTGEIADGSPQTSKLTIYYTVNGYSRSVEIEVTATYQEVINDNGHEWVDLGLPSGLKWATCNVGAQQPHEKGLYFQWGSVNGHAEGSGYNFSSSNYPESGISADLSLEQDAARAYLGGDWRMPSKEEFQELYNNCNRSDATQGGINGCLFTSKSNGNTIFFPSAGYYSSTSLNGSGRYWFSSCHSSSYAYFMYFNGTDFVQNSYEVRYFGFPVRGVL